MIVKSYNIIVDAASNMLDSFFADIVAFFPRNA